MTEEKSKGGAPGLKNYNIHQRINRMMAEIAYVKKNTDIKDKSGKKMYSVTGYDAVTAMLHPLLVKHRVNLIPSAQDMIQEGNRTRIEVAFRWVNIDNPEDFVEQKWYGYGIDYSDKGPGSAISYAQRYIVLKTLHLETGEKDIEQHDIHFEEEKTTVTPKTATVTPKPFTVTSEKNHADYDAQLDKKITPDLLNEIYEIGYGMKWQAPAIMAFVHKNFDGKNPPALTCSDGLACIEALKEFSKTAENENDLPL